MVLRRPPNSKDNDYTMKIHIKAKEIPLQRYIIKLLREYIGYIDSRKYSYQYSSFLIRDERFVLQNEHNIINNSHLSCQDIRIRNRYVVARERPSRLDLLPLRVGEFPVLCVVCTVTLPILNLSSLISL